jgi:TolA-binding protein
MQSMLTNRCRGRKRGLLLAASALAVLLVGCATPAPVPAPEPEPEAPRRSPEDVKLTLNLPAEAANCRCEETEPPNDRTFLERGMAILAAGDYVEAVQQFQRYRRLEKTELAQWEADIAITYASMLPASPFYDVEAARLAYTELQVREPDGTKHPSIVLMQQALESFVLMDRHIEDLENRNSMLEDDLEKREQALKRLRELTLGQPQD